MTRQRQTKTVLTTLCSVWLFSGSLCPRVRRALLRPVRMPAYALWFLSVTSTRHGSAVPVGACQRGRGTVCPRSGRQFHDDRAGKRAETAGNLDRARSIPMGRCRLAAGRSGQTGWAQEHHFQVRGHVVVYARDDGYTLPNWLRTQEAQITPDQARQYLSDYIHTLVVRYKGKIVRLGCHQRGDRRQSGQPELISPTQQFLVSQTGARVPQAGVSVCA